MRCPDCNKFVSFDEPQVEEDSIDVDGVEVTGSVRVVLPCAECGTELKEATLDFELLIEHECADDSTVLDDWVGDDDELEYEIVSEDYTGCDRYQDTDSKGKKITNSRYMKHFYGAEVSITVKCLRCGEEIELTETVDEQASCFDEC